MTWELLGHLALALIFGSAALLKLRSFATFSDGLRVPFRNAATSVAIAVVSTEIVIAMGLIIVVGESTILAATGFFVLLATMYVALRLILTDESECGCWGKKQPLNDNAYIGWQDDLAQSFSSIWRLARYSLRNGAILLVISLMIRDSEKMIDSDLNYAAIAAIFPSVVLVLGLVTSIIHLLRQLKLEEHPLYRVLAPRLAPLVALSWYMDNAHNGGWIVRQGQDFGSDR